MPSMTINYSVAEGQRAADAVGKKLKLIDGNGAPRPATAGECKARLIDLFREDVLSVERDTQINAIQAQFSAITTSAFDPT